MTPSEKKLLIQRLQNAVGMPFVTKQILDDAPVDAGDKIGLVSEAYSGITSGNVNRVRDESEMVKKSLSEATSSNVATTAAAVQAYLASLKK